MARAAEIARRAEALGFHGVWVTDPLARGRPALDPLALLAALAAVTQRGELGTCVVQVPLRHPVEHARRATTVQALSGGRLRFGVGAGSTQGDFDAVQQDFTARLGTLRAHLAVIRRHRGRPVQGHGGSGGEPDDQDHQHRGAAAAGDPGGVPALGSPTPTPTLSR